MFVGNDVLCMHVKDYARFNNNDGAHGRLLSAHLRNVHVLGYLKARKASHGAFCCNLVACVDAILVIAYKTAADG